MKNEHIAQLKHTFPSFFDIKDVSENWDNDYHVVAEDDADVINNDLFGNQDEPYADLDKNIEESEVISEGGDFDPDSRQLDDFDDLSDIFGNEYPGSSRSPLQPRVPVTELVGFYLPWHRFKPQVWGVYLISENIEKLALSFYKTSAKKLPIKECNLLAAAFVFHHEAYHNKVESFATRLEIAERQRALYLGSTDTLYKSGGFNYNGDNFHEESLANAYAYNRCRGIFKKYPKHQKRILTQLGLHCLFKCILSSPKHYREAIQLIQTPPQFYFPRPSGFQKYRLSDVTECFQDEILTYNTIIPKAMQLWRAAPNLLSATLRRNANFSYIVRKGSPLASRAKLAVHYLKRSAFQKQLEQKLGVTIFKAGGKNKHPWKISGTSGGKVIPFSGHGKKDFPKGTATQILKNLGLATTIDDFMRS